MLLAVDTGNTQTHFGTFVGEQLQQDWRFATVANSTADDLGAALSNLLALRGLGFADIDGLDPLLAPCRRWGRSGMRWRAATSATRC